MGFGAVAGHLILLVALFSAGALVAGAVNNNLSAQIDARSELIHRMRASASADYDLRSDGYASDKDRTYANFTNNGTEEVDLDDVTLLVDGDLIGTDQVQRFRVRDHANSNVWMPGEVLEVMTQDRGNVDITITGPYGVSAHRRN